MSAIFGLLRHDSQPARREDLHRMGAAIANRGPDGVGSITDGPVGLGVARLQTSPRPEPTAPAPTPGGIVTATVRLDNRAELIRAIGWDDDASDTALVGAAHRRWGEGAPTRLLGDFAYAVWSPDDATLTLVRDTIGVRPLYLTRSPRFTAFASDPRALLAMPEVSDDIDEVGIFNFFVPGLLLQDFQTTCYTAIKRMPPARALMITVDGRARHRTYWSLDPEREIRLGSPDAYREAFRERFEAAVARRLRCVDPVASTLSGGLDSSSISAVAARQLASAGRPPLQTFATVFPDSPEADESEFSDAVAAAIHANHHRIDPGARSPLSDLDAVLDATTEPFFAPNFFIPREVCSLASSRGSRVLLDGTDGDTTVGHGLDFFPDKAMSHDWPAFAREAKAVTSRFKSATYATHDKIVRAHALPELRRLARRGRFLALFEAVQTLGRTLGISRARLLRSAFKRNRHRPTAMEDLSHLDRGFVTRVNGTQRLRELEAHMLETVGSRRAIHWHALTAGALPSSLALFDRIGGRFQIEYRYPFCDRELIEFCLAMPIEQQLQAGWSRWVLRQALSGDLPDLVCWRGGKADLSPVYHRGLRQFERGAISRISTDPGPAVTRYLRADILGQVGPRYLEHGGAGDRQLLWRALVLDAWVSARNLDK